MPWISDGLAGTESRCILCCHDILVLYRKDWHLGPTNLPNSKSGYRQIEEAKIPEHSESIMRTLECRDYAFSGQEMKSHFVQTISTEQSQIIQQLFLETLWHWHPRVRENKQQDLRFLNLMRLR